MMTDYLNKLSGKIGLDNETAGFFTDIYETLAGDIKSITIFNSAVGDFSENQDYNRAAEILFPLSKETISGKEFRPESLYMLMLMVASKALRWRYLENGISDDIFWNTMEDLRCKIYECIAVKGFPGTFVPTWFSRHFKLALFGVGRFQFEVAPMYLNEPVEICGRTFTNENSALNIHIPGNGISLTDAVRFDSYRRGYRFMTERCGNKFDGSIVPITCHSWLLHPVNREILSESSNIRRFTDDFTVITNVCTQDNFSENWRIFGSDGDKPVSELPRDTSLRRAYADLFARGGKSGAALGIFLFDGENIVK